MTDLLPTCPAKRSLLFEMWARLNLAEEVLRIQPGALHDPVSFACGFPLRRDFAEELGLLELCQSPAVCEAEFALRQPRRPIYRNYADFVERSAGYRVPAYMFYHFQAPAGIDERALFSSDGYHNFISFEPRGMIDNLWSRASEHLTMQRQDPFSIQAKLDERGALIADATHVLIHNTILGRATIISAQRSRRLSDWRAAVRPEERSRLLFPGAFVRLRRKPR